MKASTIIGKIVLGILGASLSAWLTHQALGNTPFWKDTLLDEFLATLPGFAFGFWVVPWLSAGVVRWFVGLVTLTVQVAVARTMGAFLAAQSKRFSQLSQEREKRKQEKEESRKLAEKLARATAPVILDTSVLIDGRLFEVERAGFLAGRLILPYFIIDELRRLADSPDDLKRQRGRRGLELLSSWRKNKGADLFVWKEKVEGGDVDAQLMQLAKKINGVIATVDYNLNKAAGLLGIKILNVNDLANQIKTVILPGEVLNVKVLQKGKESGQGVGYLPDGTMVVVENGGDRLGRDCPVKVSRLLQTPAGKMVFAKITDRIDVNG